MNMAEGFLRDLCKWLPPGIRAALCRDRDRSPQEQARETSSEDDAVEKQHKPEDTPPPFF